MDARSRSAVCSFLFLLCLQATCGRVQHTQSSNTSFDLLIFTQHWPQTVCLTWREKNEDHTCSLPEEEEWSIHGIWPTKLATLGPQFCNPSLRFNATALAPLEDELKVKWIDVEVGTKHYSFWRHEWEKHGTCSATLDMLNTEFKYFQTGLRFFDEYDMKGVLAKANILPGGQYAVQDILDGIKKVLGTNAQIICVKHVKTHVSYLFEARICFDKNLQLTDCDGIVEFPTNCDKSSNVTYPSTVPYVYQAIQIF